MGKLRNRKKTQFKRGNIPHNKGIRFPKSDIKDSVKVFKWKRFPPEHYSLVTKHSTDEKSVHAPDTEGTPGSTRLLRPIKQIKSEVISQPNMHRQKTQIVNGTKGMQTVDNDKMVDMWNDVFKCHSSQESPCKGLSATIFENKKWVLHGNTSSSVKTVTLYQKSLKHMRKLTLKNLYYTIFFILGGG